MCAECEFNKPFYPSEYFTKIIFLLKLKNAGYPFGKEDLTIEQWFDMKMVEDSINKSNLNKFKGK